MVTAAEKTAAFRAAHGPGGNGLVLGNVSTPGLARGLQDLGYAALGTSSAGLADDLGLRDGEPDHQALNQTQRRTRFAYASKSSPNAFRSARSSGAIWKREM